MFMANDSNATSITAVTPAEAPAPPFLYRPFPDPCNLPPHLCMSGVPGRWNEASYHVKYEAGSVPLAAVQPFHPYA